MVQSKLDRLAVVYAAGSTSPLTIKASSLGVCDVVILFDNDCSEKDKKEIELLKKYITSYDISGLCEEEIIEILNKEDVKGILTFSEYKLPIVSSLSEKMNFIGHSKEVVQALTDKYKQREFLAKDNINVVKHTILNRENYLECYEKVGFPAILKPRVGAGSKWTKRIESLEELKDTLNEFPENIEYILEEFLEGDPSLDGKYYGDYVSVESIHEHGESKQVCITAKLPLTKDFSETGMFIPHPFSKSLEDKILEVESKAIKALGITSGITHTEIKLTADGPRIIEVNGRLGGYVSEIIKRASGIDLVKAALMIALGHKIHMNLSLDSVSKVVFEIFLDSPRVINSVFCGLDGLEKVKKIKNIMHVEVRKNIGDILDYRYGTENNIGVVYGDAENFEEFEKTINFVRQNIISKFSDRGGE
ncbi:ATP-grasp domain-containing protein [Clostridium sp. DSM 8431]|uniref:ATP-grasp domain-containing protein n=1 Tax=Clostridium sp. DSM 8431 TaxID=1761781 RepID=UPI0008F12DF6|nr:ATP-grasp domain-containing protein [Clostridium sp. DSM 8431]SFU37435.1 ATP-grasp domain-containing protein [Clostridium sp. DSM 8431]